MAKSKVQEKITINHQFKIEGELNTSQIDDGIIIVNVEEEGDVDLKYFLKKFNEKYITLNISEKTEQEPNSEE